jgi:hypothetical protein
MIIRTFAERTPNSPVSPARAAATTTEEPQAAGIDADELSHRGQGSARRAIPAKPLLLVSPTVEGIQQGAEEPRSRSGPSLGLPSHAGEETVRDMALVCDPSVRPFSSTSRPFRC